MILNKTHYGTGIYSHILRQYYPDEIVMHIVGRDCGLCRNHFNDGKNTLHVWIEKTDPTNSKSAEFARHEDSENAVPAGNAFGFAELHYKQSGEQFLQTLNREMNLRIGEQRGFYNRPQSPQISKSPCSPFSPLFSFFKAPINNIKPHSETTLRKVYNAIVGNYYRDRTQKLRAISDAAQARKFKAANFDYCTFSGTFTSRNDKALVKHSGLLCVDFDHVNSISTLFNRLLQDDYFDTQLLFRSPSGDGLKWIISIDTAQATHSDFFAAVANYILRTYGVSVDKSGRDISRACFLPHDPDAYIALTFLNSLNSSKSL
jgi:hypothetical protein